VLDLRLRWSPRDYALRIASGKLSYGRTKRSAQRLLFLLDVGFATGVRASEMAEAKLKDVETNPSGEHWTRVKGKGRKSGKVALTQLAWNALSQYRLARGQPVNLYA
jgi:Site-specific recombinase XerD